jgi:hypothetical protein
MRTGNPGRTENVHLKRAPEVNACGTTATAVAASAASAVAQAGGILPASASAAATGTYSAAGAAATSSPQVDGELKTRPAQSTGRCPVC